MASTHRGGALFCAGLRDGIPIALGYLSVSFTFGITAVTGGLPLWSAVLLSMTNLTSAGQVAGLAIILSGGSLAELALSQLVINSRYALMSLSLSQRLDSRFTWIHRLIASFGITDEIFAVASGKPGTVSSSYLYGLIALPFTGWTLGTFLGGLLGGVLPDNLRSALGIAIYAMFVAIVVPAAKRSRGVLAVCLTAILLSLAFRYIPFLSGISSGFSIVLCTLAAAAAGAFFFPARPSEENEEVPV